MARTGGEKTKASILAAAERLFAKDGFSATSVEEIAKAAKVNKALIYYYFKSKDELVLTLFRAILEQIMNEVPDISAPTVPMKDVMSTELDIIEKKRDTIALLLMESLRCGPASDFLFEVCETLSAPCLKGEKGLNSRARNKALTREFYRDIVPYIVFLVLKDKWSAYFKCTPEQAKEDFIETFMEGHR